MLLTVNEFYEIKEPISKKCVLGKLEFLLLSLCNVAMYLCVRIDLEDV